MKLRLQLMVMLSIWLIVKSVNRCTIVLNFDQAIPGRLLLRTVLCAYIWAVKRYSLHIVLQGSQKYEKTTD